MAAEKCYLNLSSEFAKFIQESILSIEMANAFGSKGVNTAQESIEQNNQAKITLAKIALKKLMPEADLSDENIFINPEGKIVVRIFLPVPDTKKHEKHYFGKLIFVFNEGEKGTTSNEIITNIISLNLLNNLTVADSRLVLAYEAYSEAYLEWKKNNNILAEDSDEELKKVVNQKFLDLISFCNSKITSYLRDLNRQNAAVKTSQYDRLLKDVGKVDHQERIQKMIARLEAMTAFLKNGDIEGLNQQKQMVIDAAPPVSNIPWVVAVFGVLLFIAVFILLASGIDVRPITAILGVPLAVLMSVASFIGGMILGVGGLLDGIGERSRLDDYYRENAPLLEAAEAAEKLQQALCIQDNGPSVSKQQVTDYRTIETGSYSSSTSASYEAGQVLQADSDIPVKARHADLQELAELAERQYQPQ